MSGSSRIMVAQEEKREAPPEPPQKPVQAPEPEPAREQPPEPPAPLAASQEPGEKAPEAAPEPELSPEIRKRIDRLNFERHDARRQLEQLQREVAAWQQQQRAAQPGQPGAEAEERALNRFRQEAAERDFNARCNEVFQRGSAEYADFGEAVRSLNAVGYGNRPDALAAIASMPDGHHVYRTLAQDLDNAARVLTLPPMQMAMELARMAQGRPNGAAPSPAPAPAPGPVTRAPAPLRGVGGNSARSEAPLDRVSMAEFIRRRDRGENTGSARIKRG